MPSSLSPANLSIHPRSRSRSNIARITNLTNTSSIPIPAVDEILFPRVYEDAWGSPDLARAELERARIFLVRFANTNANELIANEFCAIVVHPANRTVPAVAHAVKMQIFGCRHASFAATPLLQSMRCLLIKTRVADVVFTERSRSIMDFFFDPTVARNLDPLPFSSPGQVVVYKYPAARLKVAIVGGGPTALASAVSLAEKGAGSVEVHMYEQCWIERTVDSRRIVDYPPTAKRRDQVVTIQESVTTLMSEKTQQALFEGKPESMTRVGEHLDLQSRRPSPKARTGPGVSRLHQPPLRGPPERGPGQRQSRWLPCSPRGTRGSLVGAPVIFSQL